MATEPKKVKKHTSLILIDNKKNLKILKSNENLWKKAK